MDEENVHDVPRGLTLDQAQFLRFQQRQDELFAQLNQLTQVVKRIALARAPPQRAPRVPRWNVRVKDEADKEDELPEEKDQLVPRWQQRVIGINIKLKIHQFKGTSSPEEYLEWVQRVDKVFEYYEYFETQKSQLAGLEFADYANLWWENIKAKRRRDGKNEIRSWWEMKRLMHRRFVPEYYKQQLYFQLQSIRQCDMSVKDYVKEFKLLTMGYLIERQPFLSLEDVIKLAIKPVIAGSTPQGSALRWNEPRKEVEGLLKSQAESAKVKEQEVDPQSSVQCRDIKCLEFHGF
ncbi:hypothetical protein CRG98_021488 [Punica granatum]|uniref:Retrotransposon gag domain-containing protein n=1 Tax=Punica granatum TaxID=22663 RepID=A0A2I0JP93_PUNGR|nr:hypothetical protein CRG98_021488 [Punica granatum]